MKNMLKIGEFSRLSQVTVKTLHHYDELGLIKPAHIDPVTNYRFYTVEQLPRIHRIMALKEMGLSLEQIGIMLNQEMTIEELRGMFRLKQAEVEQRLREEQKRLTMLEFHLHMIELENNMTEEATLARCDARIHLESVVVYADDTRLAAVQGGTIIWRRVSSSFSSGNTM